MSMAHKSGDSGRVLGGGFEYKIPVKSWNVGLAAGGKDGVFTYDDLLPYDSGIYDAQNSTAGTGVLASVNGSVNGEVELTIPATSSANEDILSLCPKRNGIGALKFVSGKQSSGAIRFKVSDIALTRDLVVGFMDAAITPGVTNVVAAADTLAAIDFVGLRCLLGTSSMDLIYGADASSPTVHKSGAKVLVADTYVNFSLHCDGTDVFLFLDGEQVGDKVPLANVAATDLKPVVLLKLSAAIASPLTVTVDSFAGANEV